LEGTSNVTVGMIKSRDVINVVPWASSSNYTGGVVKCASSGYGIIVTVDMLSATLLISVSFLVLSSINGACTLALH